MPTEKDRKQLAIDYLRKKCEDKLTKNLSFKSRDSQLILRGVQITNNFFGSRKFTPFYIRNNFVKWNTRWLEEQVGEPQ